MCLSHFLLDMNHHSEEEEDHQNPNQKDSIPYLTCYKGELEELFSSYTRCLQWPSDSDTRLYYNCRPKIAMMGKDGKKFRPKATRQFDLILFSHRTTESVHGNYYFVGFSVTYKKPRKFFVTIIKRILRFISKERMTDLDLQVVINQIEDIKRLGYIEKFGFIFPLQSPL